MRTPFIAGNWKMNLDRAAARTLVQGVGHAVSQVRGVHVGVFPPATLLALVAELAAGTGILVGAQDCHAAPSGAFTGCVSAGMVKDAGATHVLLGHSERRQQFGEDEGLLRQKLRAALDQGLQPVLCVGEELAQREAGRTIAVVMGQLEGALEGFAEPELRALTVAYEPVWAIGTGRNATPAQAVEVHRAIRERLATRFSGDFAARVRILYGGSVTPANAGELLREAEIDGALVGGASLRLESFVSIIRAARESRAR